MENETAEESFKEISRRMGRSCVFFTLRKTTRLLSQVYDQAFKPTGLRATQFSLMMAVAGQDGVTIGKLARPLGLDRTTLSRNARLLKKQGLIDVEEGEDRREQVLKLTEQGIARLREAVPIWESVQKLLTEEVGEDRLNELLANLRELARRPNH